MDTIDIVEVIGRSKQGATRPFICRSSDGEVYFLKGHDAGRRSLICEWVCGCLAKQFGLPIAEFALANVPRELVALGTVGEIKLSDLGVGIAFASKQMDVHELTRAYTHEVPEAQKRDVVVFDWWIRNMDRQLTERGGNPNLFWSCADGLVVIDHNLAFDREFQTQDFLDGHIFRDSFRNAESDFIMRGEFATRFAHALSDWDSIVAGIPNSWHYLDSEQTIFADFDVSATKALLERFASDRFWSA